MSLLEEERAKQLRAVTDWADGSLHFKLYKHLFLKLETTILYSFLCNILMSVFLLVMSRDCTHWNIQFFIMEPDVLNCHWTVGLNVTHTLEERLNGISKQELSVCGSIGISQWLTEWCDYRLPKWNRFGGTVSILYPKKEFGPNAASSNAVQWVWKQVQM